MNTINTNPVLRTLALSAAAVVVAGGLSGCRDERSDAPPRQFLPDMDDSPKFKPQSETEFFVDGRAMRPAVKGTVAFGDRVGQDDRERADYLKESVEVYQGIDGSLPANADGTPQYVRFIPAAVVSEFAERSPVKGGGAGADQALLAAINHGREKFNIYCAVCHGLHGEGGDPANFQGGIVGRRWSYPVPSFHDPKYSDRTQKTGQDGYLFSVIRHGVPDADPAKPPKMPAYADKVSEHDSWAIVAYLRTLQAAWRDPNPPAAAPAPAASNVSGASTTPIASGAPANSPAVTEVKP